MKQGKERQSTVTQGEMQSKIKSNETQNTQNPPQFIDYRMMFIYC